MQLIKPFIGHTFVYGLIQQSRARRASVLWTARDQKMLEFYSQFVDPSGLYFDVGANVGNRVKIFLKLGCNVVAVEPQPGCTAMLKAAYGKNRKLKIVRKALGESEGQAAMMISNTSVISSLSPEWVQAVKQSGRFSEHSWDKKRVVSVTTLDRLIEEFGVPCFIKIDVEGFEYQVLKGLSQPVKALSLEFTPEFIESTFKCIEYLQALGNICLNYSLGETMQLALNQWVTPEEITQILQTIPENNLLFGDIYVKFKL